MERQEKPKSVEGAGLVSAMDWLKQKGQQGAAELAAYGRGGLKDLQDVVVNAFPDSQKQNDVLGMAGNPTPGEVDKAKEVGSVHGEQSKSSVMNIGAAPKDQGKEEKKSSVMEITPPATPQVEQAKDRGGRDR